MIGLAFALLHSAASPTAAPSALPDSCLVFAQPQHDFGEAFAGSRLTHSFRVTNRCPRPVTIGSVRGRAQLGSGRPGKDILAPGEAGEVLVYQLLGDDLGRRRYRFEVTASLPGSPTWELTVQGFVLSAYDPPRPEVSLGDVDVAEGKAGRVELFCRETGTVRLLGADGAAGLEVREAGRVGGAAEGSVVEARLLPGAPPGPWERTVTLRTDCVAQPELKLTIRARLAGPIVPDQDPVFLGVARVGERLEKLVLLRSRSARPVRVRAASSGADDVSVKAEPCPGDEPGCAALRIAVPPQPAQRGISGLISVEVEGEASPVTIRYHGNVVGLSSGIRDVQVGGTPSPQSDRAIAGSPLPTVPIPPPTGTAAGVPARPETTTDQASDSAGPPHLRWKALDDRVFGYLVLRGESRDGPFRRVNARLVQAESDPTGASRRYSWIDAGAPRGRTSFYRLEAIFENGSRQLLPGVVSKFVAGAP